MNNIQKLTTAAIIGTIGVTAQSLLDDNHVDAATLMTTMYNVNLRVGPGTYYRSAGIKPANSSVYVTETKNGWSKTSGGYYIYSQYLTKSSNNNYNNNSTYKSKYMYTAYALNLRSGIGTNSRKILTMPKGAKVTVLSESSGWCKVKYNGYTGWCAKQYLSSTYKDTNIANKKDNILINKIVVNRAKHTLTCYSNGKYVNSFPCAVGKASTPTPSGTFNVIGKEANRPYYKKGIPGGAANNPLGPRFIQLTRSGYAIHGNCNASSIGKNVSDGCIRMYNDDVIWLYDRVKTYQTIVVII